MSTDKSRGRLGCALTALALLGVASLVLLPIERLLPEPQPLSTSLVRILSLINPALLAVGAAWTGAILAYQVRLDAPVLRQLLVGSIPFQILRRQLRQAIYIGLGVGLLLAAYAMAAGPYFALLDAATISRMEAVTPPLATRLLYGGLTEEIVARWGMMTFIIWLVWRIKERPQRLADKVYWLGIFASASAFSAAHLPLLYQVAAAPPIWLTLAALTTNLLAGSAFGWLYWRRGLEAAMIAHALAHLAAALIAITAS